MSCRGDEKIVRNRQEGDLRILERKGPSLFLKEERDVTFQAQDSNFMTQQMVRSDF